MLYGAAQPPHRATDPRNLPPQRSPPCAGHIVAIGGRFAALPVDALVDTPVHFLHGKEDAVIPYRNTVLAAHHLRDLGCDITTRHTPAVDSQL